VYHNLRTQWVSKKGLTEDPTLVYFALNDVSSGDSKYKGKITYSNKWKYLMFENLTLKSLN